VLRPNEFPLQIVKRCREPFDGDEWLFEIKHDGFRVLAIRDGGSARLFTRNGYDISRRHRQITERLNELLAERFVLDGEMVVLDDDGRSNFARLAHGRTGSHYYAFDILMLGNDDLRGLPLRERKSILKTLVSGCDP
jgi:bifunctional non-homologous end joining protein LigD